MVRLALPNTSEAFRPAGPPPIIALSNNTSSTNPHYVT
jgi:hypothetical protein